MTARTATYLTLILLSAASALFISLTKSINLPTYHLDGAFQTASGLYRLDSGQLVGRDFFPYLGIAPLYILYPLFKALGANLAASVFTAQLVTLLLGALSVALIWHLIFCSRSFLRSLAIGSLLFLLPVVLLDGLRVPFPPALHASIPGNSLRPIRSAAPYLTVLAYYFLALPITRTRVRYAVC